MSNSLISDKFTERDSLLCFNLSL